LKRRVSNSCMKTSVTSTVSWILTIWMRSHAKRLLPGPTSSTIVAKVFRHPRTRISMKKHGSIVVSHRNASKYTVQPYHALLSFPSSIPNPPEEYYCIGRRGAHHIASPYIRARCNRSGIASPHIESFMMCSPAFLPSSFLPGRKFKLRFFSYS